MAQKFTDAARALLSAAITSSDTSISIASGGSLFPVANTGASAISDAADWFKAVLQATDGYEVIYVRTHTSASTSFTNVLRGQDGTTARAFAIGDVIGIRPLATDADAWTNQRVSRTSSTGSAKQPSGTTAQRDGSPAAGYFRFNSDTGAFEGYNGTTWQSIGASGMISSVAELTATAGQTVFTTGYTAGLIDVYKNGARLGAADYVATNGTSVSLVVGAALNDHIAVVKYVAGTISNAVAKSGDTMSGALNFAPRATVASASTTDVGAAAANGVSITGTTTITSLGTAASGIKRTLTFAGALVLTHNATSLILPGAANIATAAGDVAEVESLGSGNWRCVAYTRASGQPVVSDLALTSVNSGQVGGLRNKVINGKMEIAQRGTSFPSTVLNQYALDRWVLGGSGTDGVVNVSQAGGDTTGFSSLSIGVATADTSIASGQSLNLQHRIEGYNIVDLIGVPITLSFRVYSSKTGTHCVSLINGGGDRSYVAEYVVNAANTWETKSITIPGGLITAGTWNYTNGSGLTLRWALAAGSSVQTTPNTWQTGNFQATSNQVNCMDTAGNLFAITKVQLEVGSVATPFENRPYGMELALCQRYYYRETPGAADKGFSFTGQNANTTTVVLSSPFKVPMRIAPSALEQSGTANHYSVYSGGAETPCSSVPVFFSRTTKDTGFCLFNVASGLSTGQNAMGITNSTNGAAAFLGWSAEL